jgi:hypothetical protein
MNDDVAVAAASAILHDRNQVASKYGTPGADRIISMLRSIPEGASVIRIDADASDGTDREPVQQRVLSPVPFPCARYALITHIFDRIRLVDVESVLQKIIAAGVSRILFTISFFPADSGLLRTIRKDLSFGYRNFRSRIGRHEKGHDFLHSEQDVRAMLQRLGLAINAENLIVKQRYTHNVMIDACIPPLPTITLIDRCVVRGDRCEIDGKLYPVHRGRWACYVPDLGFKLLYGVGGQLHCTHGSAPNRQELFAGRAAIGGSYTSADWLAAFSKKVTRRAAENYVAAYRLASAGIGPAVRGCVAVREFVFAEGIDPGMSAGIRVDNLEAYPRKRDTTRGEMLRAGVEPDRIRSSLRQQIRGYVSDLNSVVGVMPVNAGGEISRLEAALDNVLSPPQWS